MPDLSLTLPSNVPVVLPASANGQAARYRVTNLAPMARSGNEVHLNVTGSVDPKDDLASVVPGASNEVVATGSLFVWSASGGPILARVPESLGAVSRITGWHPGANGLSRWLAGLGQVGKTAGGQGLGGVDVVCIGDSLTECMLAGSGVGQQFTPNGLNDYLCSKWTHTLKVMLQKALNPPGVQGGYGFVPSYSFASYAGAPAAGAVMTTFGTVSSTPNIGTAGRCRIFDPGANGAFLTLDPTAVPAEFRFNVTSVDFVAPRGADKGAAIRYDVKAGGAGGAAMIGTGGQTGTLNLKGAEAWGTRSRVAGIGRTSAQTIQIAANATGTAGSDSLFLDGVILYDGDESCGVRVHNLGRWGGRALLLASAALGGSSGSDANLLASIDAFGTGALGGATQVKLATINWMTNDVGTGAAPVTDVPTYKARVVEQVDRLLALPSKPNVILIVEPIQQASNFGANYAAGRANQLAARAAIYEIAAARPDVSVLDLWEFLGLGDYTGLLTTYRWHGDGVHRSDVAQRAQAEILFRILMSGQG